MSTDSPKKGFSFSIPMALTIILLAFFILFRGAISNLISGGNCLEMEFFESKINTCNEEMAKQSLLSDQQEISGLLKSMKAKIDSLESVNGSLNNQIILMNREKVEDGTEAMITMSSGAVLSAEERLLYEKYSAPTD